MNAVDRICAEQIGEKKIEYSVGDTVEVSSKVVEGDKERLQMFRGIIIQIKGSGIARSVTVRKITQGIGVEKIFPVFSPNVMEVKIVRQGKVRRAKLNYLRDRKGKSATKIKVKE